MKRWAWRTMLASSCAVLFAAAVQAEDWPAFRGPTGLSVSKDTGFATEWAPDKNIAWKADLPNRGNESPIVVAGKVFVTSATNDGTERRLHCFDRKDGKALWTKSVTIDAKEETHGTNPFGAATPVSDGKRVVVWHGSAGLYCYDLDGHELWKSDFGKVQHIWGYGSSPVLAGNKVLLNFGPGKEQFVVAVNLEDGKQIWRFDEPGGNNNRDGRMVGSWSTPVVVEIDGQQQVVCSLPTRVLALDLEKGQPIWWCSGLSGKNGDLVYTSPLISGKFGVAMGGYTGPAIGFKVGGQGDVTEQQRLWQVTQGNPQRIGSGVIIGDHVFMANAGPGYFQCLELGTGKELWRERGEGKDHWGAMILAEGRLYVTNQAGTTTVFKPNAEKFELIATNAMNEASNSTPAFSEGDIFLRTNQRLYCVRAKR